MNTSRVGNYTVFDQDKDDDSTRPLLEALRFAIQPYKPLSYFLDGIFLDIGFTGGDPGWVIERRLGGPEGKTFWVYLSSDYSYEEEDEFWYDEATVKRHVRRTLENFAIVNRKSKKRC
jgi:hypothetical protein